MTRAPHHASSLSWLAALGLACLASSLFMHRRDDDARPLPEHLYRRADDLQRRLFA